MLEKERNLTEFCFICGFEREKLDKSTEHGYYSHIKVRFLIEYLFYRKTITCGTMCTTKRTSPSSPKWSSAATKPTSNANSTPTISIGSL
jgi:hypothetical protein